MRLLQVLLLFVLTSISASAALPPYQRWALTTNTLANPASDSFVVISSTGGLTYRTVSTLNTTTNQTLWTATNQLPVTWVDGSGAPFPNVAHWSWDNVHLRWFFDAPIRLQGPLDMLTGISVPTGYTINADGTGITNIIEVSSIDVPMGAWFTNNIDSGIGPTITPAQAFSITNMGDGFIFSHTNGTSAVTNVIRTRFSLPWDWDAQPVKVGIISVCSGTNSSAATNMVFAVRAVAVDGGDNLTNVTFGAFQRVVGNVGTNAWVQGSEAITPFLTIGNSASNTKSIVWEVQRWGGDASDTETNFNLFISQIRIYYSRSTRVDFP